MRDPGLGFGWDCERWKEEKVVRRGRCEAVWGGDGYGGERWKEVGTAENWFKDVLQEGSFSLSGKAPV